MLEENNLFENVCNSSLGINTYGRKAKKSIQEKSETKFHMNAAGLRFLQKPHPKHHREMHFPKRLSLDSTSGQEMLQEREESAVDPHDLGNHECLRGRSSLCTAGGGTGFLPISGVLVGDGDLDCGGSGISTSTPGWGSAYRPVMGGDSDESVDSESDLSLQVSPGVHPGCRVWLLQLRLCWLWSSS